MSTTACNSHSALPAFGEIAFHRQDQAILTALVQSARIEKSCIAIKSTGVRYHQECDSDESCRKSREFLKGLLRVH